MARKGWDALSDSYRRRLERQGVSERAYESGQSLHRARGHVSQPEEAFRKRVSRFVHTFGVPDDDFETAIEEVRDLGPRKGQEFMDYRRAMVRAYERGDYQQAATMYKRRDKSIHVPEYLWWYHGMFGG